jgi:glycopeptide antibiotics resistance protein
MNILKVYFDYFMFLVRQQMEGASVAVFLVTCVILVTVFLVFFYLIEKVTGKKISSNKKRAIMLMAVYACFIFQIAFYRRFGLEKSVIHTRIYFGFKKLDGTMDEKQVVYSFLNVIFFIPWGVLIASAMNNNFKRIIMTVVYSFLTSLLIEVMQYITMTGATEVTDLVTNVTGGFIGCLLYMIANLSYEKVKGLREGRT